MTRTTSELAPPSPNFRATPTGGRLATTYDLACNRPHTRRIFSGIGFRTCDPPVPRSEWLRRLGMKCVLGVRIQGLSAYSDLARVCNEFEAASSTRVVTNSFAITCFKLALLPCQTCHRFAKQDCCKLKLLSGKL
ncbi:hypothetical protein AVEN_146463-1 [Araneus ventricosus]|uniref:Uncharacterized protein n=1 Tax=Araneus ventricosus TaxID=182803 RepID=A0A4Y2REU2_ARAVE|nr:hypothetical protein AVEN_146463-1 [Araneus ventricosus]